MKKNINMAQEYLDAEKPIPDTLTGKMDLEELSIIVRMQHFKNDIEKALNKEIDETPIHFDAPPNTNEQPVTGHSFPYRHYFLIPAAALLGIAIGLSMMHSLTTRNLVREDVKASLPLLPPVTHGGKSLLKMKVSPPTGLMPNRLLKTIRSVLE